MHPLLILPPPISISAFSKACSLAPQMYSTCTAPYQAATTIPLCCATKHDGLPFGAALLWAVRTCIRKYSRLKAPSLFQGFAALHSCKRTPSASPPSGSHFPSPHCTATCPALGSIRSQRFVCTHLQASCLFAPAFWRPTNLTPERKQSPHESTHPPQGNPGPRHQPHGPLGPGSGRPCRRRPVHHPPPHRKWRAHSPHHLGF